MVHTIKSKAEIVLFFFGHLMTSLVEMSSALLLAGV